MSEWLWYYTKRWWCEVRTDHEIVWSTTSWASTGRCRCGFIDMEDTDDA